MHGHAHVFLTTVTQQMQLVNQKDEEKLFPILVMTLSSSKDPVNHLSRQYW